MFKHPTFRDGPVCLRESVCNRQLWRHHLKWRAELRGLSRRVSSTGAVQRLHLQRPQALFPQPLFTPALELALGEAAKAAKHDNESPDQPESGKACQKCIGALRHHHDDHLDKVCALQDPVGRFKVLRRPAGCVVEFTHQVSKHMNRP